ncbi:MAG: sensor histidine kinase, partial [Alphaproteobacteria bacterium]
EATPSGRVGPELEAQLLRHVGAYAIDLHLGPLVTRMLGLKTPPEPDIVVDLERESAAEMILNAFGTLMRSEPTVLRVNGRSPQDPSVLISAILPEAPMRTALIDYSGRILQLSLGISFFTALLVFFTLRWLLVRPMRRLTEAIVEFRATPEDPTRGVRESGRRDEIGVAERELAAMQRDLRLALAQKARLAALGEAVAKINHDLRNILASAQLVSDSLTDSGDPKVQRLA